jgi:hypothetical protein
VSYPFVKTDAGRTASRRPKQKNDCTVRALVHVTGEEYDVVYDRIAEAGRKSHGRFDLKKYLAADPRFKWVPFPAVAGQSRMNPPTFSRLHPKGKWIARTAKHVHAVIDGVHYDTDRLYDARCIYGAWGFEG